MTSPVTIQEKMYGHRARIGYTSPPLTTEVFPYEFYKIVPDGVTLVVTSLAIVVRSKAEIDQSYDISMKAVREMAAAGCDIVVLGGVPINLSRGAANAEQIIRDLEAELKVKVSTALPRKPRPPRCSAARRWWWRSPMPMPTPTASPAMPTISAARCWARPAGGARSTRSAASRSTPRSRWAASKREHPEADTIMLPSPHWLTNRGVSMCSNASLALPYWPRTRRSCGRAPPLRRQRRIEGSGRLLREF
jgi:hypothetical protein